MAETLRELTTHFLFIGNDAYQEPGVIGMMANGCILNICETEVKTSLVQGWTRLQRETLLQAEEGEEERLRDIEGHRETEREKREKEIENRDRFRHTEKGVCLYICVYENRYKAFLHIKRGTLKFQAILQ